MWSVRTGFTVQRQWCNGPQWLLAVALLNNVKPNMHKQMDLNLFALPQGMGAYSLFNALSRI